jgi:hypothetical protein
MGGATKEIERMTRCRADSSSLRGIALAMSATTFVHFSLPLLLLLSKEN